MEGDRPGGQATSCTTGASCGGRDENIVSSRSYISNGEDPDVGAHSGLVRVLILIVVVVVVVVLIYFFNTTDFFKSHD